MSGPITQDRQPSKDPILVAAEKLYDVTGLPEGMKFDAYDCTVGDDGKLYICGAVSVTDYQLHNVSLDILLDDKIKPAVLVDGKLTIIDSLNDSARAISVNRRGELLISNINHNALLAPSADTGSDDAIAKLVRRIKEQVPQWKIDEFVEGMGSLPDQIPLEEKMAEIGPVFNYLLASPSVQTGGYTFQQVNYERCGFDRETGEIVDTSGRPFGFRENKKVQDRLMGETFDYTKVTILGRIEAPESYHYGSATLTCSGRPQPFAWRADDLTRYGIDFGDSVSNPELRLWRVVDGRHILIVQDQDENAIIFAGSRVSSGS